MSTPGIATTPRAKEASEVSATPTDVTNMKRKPYMDSQRIARLAQFRRARSPEARNDDGTPRSARRGRSHPRFFQRDGNNTTTPNDTFLNSKKKKQQQEIAQSQDDAYLDGVQSIKSELSTSFSFFDKFRSKHQRKVMFHHFGNVPKDVLTVVELSKIPEPESPHDVIIKVAASTVSFMDCMHRRGICLDVLNPVSLPSTPGMDALGSILKCGSAVRGWKEGDRVAVLLRTGGNARYVNVPATSLVEVPRVLDNAEAACLISTYMTAYQSLKLALKSCAAKNNLNHNAIAAAPPPPPQLPTTTIVTLPSSNQSVYKSRFLSSARTTVSTALVVTNQSDKYLQGKRVLITCGISPIGQALIQLCSRAGADQIFTTAPEQRHRYIKSVLGATPLPLNPTLWLPIVQGKMDVVFDGSCDDGFESPHAAMKPRGVMVVFGMSALLSKEEPGFLGAPITAYWTKIKGQMFLSNTKSYEIWESFQADPEIFKRDLAQLFTLLRNREIKPHIAKRVGLSEVVDAHSYLEKGRARGDIVCLPWKRLGNKVDGREGPDDDEENRTL